MEYGLTKKLTFCLIEYVFRDEYDDESILIENDLCSIIHQLEKEDWRDLYMNYDRSLNVLHNIQYNNRFLYSWINNIEDFISYLEQLPVIIAEEQMEREIARSEAINDFIYENGYREYMLHGF